ncbi:hypothetical protein BJ165DRAFT_1535493 [Panaeolus papilionaceus]|nr:hypothetical protein BJ165DRAFT_1535493 [Panaeolus papilionaceus]
MFERELYDVVHYLSFFFKNESRRHDARVLATTFREALMKSNSIVVGSFACNFIDGTRYGPTCVLDVVVARIGAVILDRWAVASGFIADGYEMNAEYDYPKKVGGDTQTVQMSTHRSTIYEMNIFTHPSSGRKIRLMTCDNTPFETLLHNAMTHTMTCFDHEIAYSAYPVSTFEERCTLDRRLPIVKNSALAMKYRQRGWSVMYRIDEDEVRDRNTEWWEGVRSFGDHKSLNIRLRPRLHAEITAFPRANAWDVFYVYKQGLRMRIDYHVLSCKVLRNARTTSRLSRVDDIHGEFHAEARLEVEKSDAPIYGYLDAKYSSFYNRRIAVLQAAEYVEI